MKNIFAIAAVSSVLLAACGTVLAPEVSVNVHMKPNSFEPSTFTIKKDQKVCWINEDTEGRWPASNIHPTHEIYSEFDPKGPMQPGTTWCFTFDKTGIWKFHDHLFPELIGTVTVED